MRYLITFSYDGTNFNGYQRQPNLRTVEGELENALKYISGGSDIIISASGRTDKGVHALKQTAHFDFDKDITCYKLKCALNTYTGHDIYVNNVEVVDNDFHARYMVKEKEYTYKINLLDYNPIERNYVYQYNKGLDIDYIKEQSKYLIGTHDFKAFVNQEDIKESYVRSIYDINISCDNGIVTLVFSGNGFLKYQVRNMVGALIECSVKKKSIKKILDSKDRSTFGKIAGAEGLYLTNVLY